MDYNRGPLLIGADLDGVTSGLVFVDDLDFVFRGVVVFGVEYEDFVILDLEGRDFRVAEPVRFGDIILLLFIARVEKVIVWYALVCVSSLKGTGYCNCETYSDGETVSR